VNFASRQVAGQRLGQYLAEIGVQPELVLGLPRGGVIVAAQVAQGLRCPIDVLVVRKIGHPHFREFAVGALAEADVVVLDQTVLKRAHVDLAELEMVIAEEKRRLTAYQEEFARPSRPRPEGKGVAIVDDGLATGATMEAAVLSARRQNASTVIVVVPVASTSGAERISKVCDQFHALLIDSDFQAVGQYYDSFEQTTDEEVQSALSM
jgi:predicted phosphoribosyltransferase